MRHIRLAADGEFARRAYENLPGTRLLGGGKRRITGSKNASRWTEEGEALFLSALPRPFSVPHKGAGWQAKDRKSTSR